MKDSYFTLEDNVLATVSLFPPDENGVALITGIEVTRAGRGQGRATRVLVECLADADREEIILMLGVEPQEFDVTFEGLIRFYERFGFQFQLSQECMIRFPKVGVEVSAP